MLVFGIFIVASIVIALGLVVALLKEESASSMKKNKNFDTFEESESLSYKLYTVKEISIATFLGSPLAACFLLSVNFENFGDLKASKRVLFWGIILVVI